MVDTVGVIARIQRAYAQQTLSATQVVDDCLARIEHNDQQGPALNAVVAINQQARDVARRLDAFVNESRQLVGPLHGVPVVVKDNFHTADMPTRASCRGLSEQLTPIESTITRKLREAGAIMLAKTNMHELALAGTTVSSLGGQTRNPYDLTRTPGGSSGGTGAALAAGYGLVGLGTDTVNSIRSPASAHALVGLRPTRGMVSRGGLIPVCESQDAAGPLVHTVADAAQVLNVIVGFDPADPATAYAAGNTSPCYVQALAGSTLKGARLGVMRSLFGTEPQHAPVNAVMDSALQAMREVGAYCIDIDDEHVDSPRILRDLDVQKWEFAEEFNAYLATRRDPDIGTLTQLLDSGNYYPALQGFLQQANAVTNRWDDPEYPLRLARMAAMRRHLLFLMAQHNVDALVYPLQKRLVVPLDETDQADRNGIVAAVSGLPAINVPAGFSEPDSNAPLGVPVGMDIMGRPFQEARLLQIAAAFERAMPVRQSPANLPPVWGAWGLG